MGRTKDNNKRIIKNIKCECGYQNNPDFVMYSGVCHGCGKVLDEKAHFKYIMNKKLRLWIGKRMWK